MKNITRLILSLLLVGMFGLSSAVATEYHVVGGEVKKKSYFSLKAQGKYIAECRYQVKGEEWQNRTYEIWARGGKIAGMKAKNKMKSELRKKRKIKKFNNVTFEIIDIKYVKK